ncbi:BACON domain-containing protein [Proteiniphilum acetatigenes]|uniref:BACON domain-containing protein n=1 Tax=Proteiniphilum acetatigenes TaxID=294710 RepID=UPI00039D745E|nr:BACON domain-containing protein [Proteiniphilum acetatigenes]
MKKLLFSMSLLVILAACGKEEPPIPALQVSPGQIEMESAGGDKDVTVTANINWTASSGASDWCTVSPASGSNNGSFKVTVKPNTTLSARETEITVKGENLEKKITVTQDAASKEELLSGSTWEMTRQGSGISDYDDLVGTTIEFKADKKAVATLHLDLGDLGTIEKIEGTWRLDGETFIIEGDIIPGLSAKLTFEIKQMTELVMECQMNTPDLPGMLPTDGIPVVFKKK